MPRSHIVPCVFLIFGLGSGLGCGGGAALPPSSPNHVIEIDLDDHGLGGLWMANAPHLKGFIARGTLAFSRVIVPTHSNQNNMALLTGQYPEGTNVPTNSWLSRTRNFVAPVSLFGFPIGDYLFYDQNPLLTRNDSVYRAVGDAGQRSAYVGQLPPFEAGASDVHFSIVGIRMGSVTATPEVAQSLLTTVLRYPPGLVKQYAFDGPAAAGETQAHFTLRDAAAFVRATSPAHPMPAFMFVWDFLGLDDDPTMTYGADGPALARIIEDYDDGLGQLLAALGDKGLIDSTNILLTLDHGKVDAHYQAVLGTRGGGGGNGAMPADGQLAAVVSSQGPAMGFGTDSYALLNEEGDAQIYARVDGAGTAAGADAQSQVTHQLLSLIQSGAILGIDTTRTLTADGAMGTRTFHDFRASGPNQPDIIVFPADDWTLNQVDATNTLPGLFQEHTQYPYGRHGGFSVDELYVPLIMAGPAFKSGVLMPHPVEHPQIPSTALATLGSLRLRTAARGPISAALAGDAGETVPQPQMLESARDLVLQGGGFAGTPDPVRCPRDGGHHYRRGGPLRRRDFRRPGSADAAGPLRALAARGIRFEDFWTRSRDWPVTEYQLLTGGYPVDPWVPAAEDDPTQTFAPGSGLLAMPPPATHVANSAGYDAWRSPGIFATETLFDTARGLGMTTALIGQTDFHDLHVDVSQIDVRSTDSIDDVAGRLSDLVTMHPRLFAVVAIRGARTADRHAAAAVSELANLATLIADLAARVPDALLAITSRGATNIDDPGADFYGPETSRHVPLVLLGPNVRTGIVSSQPGSPADIPATVLFGLGVPTATDFALGTWAAGASVAGIPQPRPSTATEGHALTRAFRTH